MLCYHSGVVVVGNARWLCWLVLWRSRTFLDIEHSREFVALCDCRASMCSLHRTVGGLSLQGNQCQVDEAERDRERERKKENIKPAFSYQIWSDKKGNSRALTKYCMLQLVVLPLFYEVLLQFSFCTSNCWKTFCAILVMFWMITIWIVISSVCIFIPVILNQANANWKLNITGFACLKCSWFMETP